MTLLKELIAVKRDGHSWDQDQISQIVAGITTGSASDSQLGALAMAVLLQGLSTAETVDLTLAMRDSGYRLSWDLPGPVVDKHSTGGIGDNVSLILAPALAACGAFVPMISGRGLGHTGGTLDKLDAIPGYISQPDQILMQNVTRSVGCAIIGQTSEIAPADKRLYAIRDITGTVESPALICASILSKKLAAGLDHLVLDIKFGSGAFMQTPAEAAKLGELLVAVSNGAGCKTTALLTDMNEPLASAAGNALEVENAVELLRGDAIDNRLWDATIALGGELLCSSGLTPSPQAGRERIAGALSSGKAAEKFEQMVAALGGPTDFLQSYQKHLPRAPVVIEVFARDNGFVQTIDTKALGMAVVNLGGGRRTSGDQIDYSVGLNHLAGIGALVDHETPIARVHAASAEAAEKAVMAVSNAYSIGPDVPDPGDVVARRIV